MFRWIIFKIKLKNKLKKTLDLFRLSSCLSDNYMPMRASLLVHTDVELLAWSVPQQVSRFFPTTADCRHAVVSVVDREA